MAQSLNQQYCGPVYPSLILPCNRINLKLGGCSTRPAKVLNVLTLPAEFPMVLAFAHALSQVAATMKTDSSPAAKQQMASALSMCLQGLSKFLNRINCPIPLKEVALHLLSDIMWTLCHIVEAPEGEGEGSTLYTFPTKFIPSAQQELLKLYSAESSKFSKAKWSDSKHAFPPPMSIAAGGLGRYSTYFQALLEFVLAALDYQHRFHGANMPVLSSSTTLVSASATMVGVSTVGGASNLGGGGGSTSSLGPTDSATTVLVEAAQETPPPSIPQVATSSSSPVAANSSKGEVCAASVVATPTDPVAGGKKVKRGRSRKGMTKKDSSSSETAPKKEEWLSVVHQATTLLRAVATPVDTSPGGIVQLQKPESSAHPSSRLVVLVGIAPSLTLEAAEAAVKKACKRFGGLYKDQLYLPSDTSNPLQHCGHAVLELCCNSHTSAVCSALLDSAILQQEEINMQALAVTNSFSCGSQELEAQKVLVAFLRSRLADGAKEAAAAMADIFHSSCPEGVSAIATPSVTGHLLKFMTSFAELCAVSTENFVAGLWDEFGGEGGLLDLEGFNKCVEQDFMLDDNFAMRGVWLGLIECGYDLHLEGYVNVAVGLAGTHIQG